MTSGLFKTSDDLFEQLSACSGDMGHDLSWYETYQAVFQETNYPNFD
jgi:hypothetical protein